MDGYDAVKLDRAIRDVQQVQQVLFVLEAYMTRRFHHLAMGQGPTSRTPEQNQRIDELKRVLRVIQGDHVDPADIG